MSFLIEPLRRSHDRKNFCCSDDSVDRFLREKAMQDQTLELSRTRVLIDTENSERVIGFHTLLISQIPQEQIPRDRPIIKRPVPVILLGQVGVDNRFQGRGYGGMLLTDAQFKVMEIAEKVGVRALMLDARNEGLVRWYEANDFVRPEASLRMAKHIDDIRRLFAKG